MKILTALALCAIIVGCCPSHEADPNPNQLPVGTVVKHKTGGPVFVIVDYWGGRAICRYYNEKSGEYVQESFNESELQETVR